jgi:hypothetical protein
MPPEENPLLNLRCRERRGAALASCSLQALGRVLGFVPPLSLTGIRKLLFFLTTFSAKWFSDLRGSSQDVTF